MATRTYSVFRIAYPVTALTLMFSAPLPAKADFFDDLRQTFRSDIPHFFQDDIPCAFGGQPTSHTKASCRSDHPPKHARETERDEADIHPDETPETQRPSPNSDK
jgi:hypothetical protein